MVRPELVDLLGSTTIGERLDALRAIAERGAREYAGRAGPLSEADQDRVLQDSRLVRLTLDQGGVFEAIGMRNTARVFLALLEDFLPRFREIYPKGAAYPRALRRLRRTIGDDVHPGPRRPRYDDTAVVRSFDAAILTVALWELASAVWNLLRAWMAYVWQRDLPQTPRPGDYGFESYIPSVAVWYDRLAGTTGRVGRHVTPELAQRPAPPIWFEQPELSRVFSEDEYAAAVRSLLGTGVDVNAAIDSPDRPITPLAAASLVGNVEVVRLLLEAGAGANDQPDGGSLALEFAVGRGTDETVALLLAHGAREGKPAATEGADETDPGARRRARGRRRGGHAEGRALHQRRR